MKDIVLIGGFSEIIDLCKGSNFNNIYVIDKKDVGQSTIYLGDDHQIDYLDLKKKDLIFCITPDLPNIRQKLYDNIVEYKLNFKSLVARNVFLSDSSIVKEGCVLQYGSFVSSNVTLERFVKLNVNACVMHDSRIGEFSTLAPSCTILGRVNIGNKCYIGSAATILPSISICDNVIVGAGAIVTKDIQESGVYAGIPAVKIK